MSKTQPTDTDIPLDYDENSGAASVETIEEPDSDQEWIDFALANFTAGKNYMDAALTTQWERNADHFNSRHYRRSAYNSKLFKGRSRLFRPLSRSSERSSSSKIAAALFSNRDVVDAVAENQSDDLQVASARVMKEILSYRLDKTIPWYLTVMGAWQDTRVYGPCATYTWWNYQEIEVEADVPVKDVKGNVIKGRFKKEKTMKVVKDEPVIEMMPPENIIFDPQCDWRDPVNTSPYMIRLVPMHVSEIQERMESIDSKTGQPLWKEHSVEDIIAAGSGHEYNAVRQAREGDDRPEKSDTNERSEFQTVWCHENFVRLMGVDYVYWTLGTSALLTDPVPIEEVYFTGKRPVIYGFSIIEAHKYAPSSATELISQLQVGVNDIANLRFDNVKLALNKRYIIRRGASVDLEALMRSVPGGGIMTDDPERDVKVIDTRDVTGSSYKEQERLETESNDLSGSFLGGSVQNNRSLNETVGGMEMLSAGADDISEFDIKTFVETWVKPQLELLIQYIQKYETDDVIMNVSFDQAMKDLGIKYMVEEPELNEGVQLASPMQNGAVAPSQVKQIKDKVLNDKMTIRVNVGLGATSPQKKIDMMSYVIKAYGSTGDPAILAKLDWDEIGKEIFAAAGFQDGARFLKSDEDQPQMTPEQQQQVQKQIEQAFEQGKAEGINENERLKIESHEKVAIHKANLDDALARDKMAAQAESEDKRNRSRLHETLIRDKTQRDSKALDSKNLREELKFKRETGKPGA